MAPDTCPSCGATRAATFCCDCGERRVDAREFGVGHFVGQVFAGITTLDGRLLGSLRSLLFSPGLLTADWIRGKRVKRLRPFQLFLLVNLVAVLLGKWFNLPGMSTTSEASEFRPWFAQMQAQAERLGMTDVLYGELYRAKSTSIARATTGVMVPVVALFSFAVHCVRERRPGVHLTLAAHAVAFLLLVPDLLFMGVFGPLLRALETDNDVAFVATHVIMMLPFACMGAWWYFADRRVFNTSRVQAIWRSVLACGTVFFGGVLLHQVVIFKLTLKALE